MFNLRGSVFFPLFSCDLSEDDAWYDFNFLKFDVTCLVTLWSSLYVDFSESHSIYSCSFDAFWEK